MQPRDRSGVSTKIEAVTIVVALGIAGVVLILSAPARQTASTTRSTASASQTTSAATNTTESCCGTQTGAVASNGIELATLLNPTELKVGQRLGVSISLFNTLSQVNAVNTSANFLFNGVPVALWPGCYGAPARVDILQGDYGTPGLQAVTNVTFPFMCSGGPASVNSAVFQPRSDQVSLTGEYCAPPGPPAGCASGTDGPYLLSLNFTASGYYDLANLSQLPIEPVIAPPGESGNPPSSIPFTPGTYTVVVVDEWGSLNLLHFEVKA